MVDMQLPVGNRCKRQIALAHPFYYSTLQFGTGEWYLQSSMVIAELVENS